MFDYKSEKIQKYLRHFSYYRKVNLFHDKNVQI